VRSALAAWVVSAGGLKIISVVVARAECVLLRRPGFLLGCDSRCLMGFSVKPDGFEFFRASGLAAEVALNPSVDFAESFNLLW